MIVTDANKLRIQCVPVELHEVPDLRKKLEDALAWSASRGRPGIGLACPQIGIGKSMAIVRLDGLMKFDLVNARITQRYDLFEFDGEGCLSFPNLYVKTKRYREILVEENLVPPHRFVLTELGAIVAQHELDHLNMVLLPDIAVIEA